MNDERPSLDGGAAISHATSKDEIDTWLILPVVICLS